MESDNMIPLGNLTRQSTSMFSEKQKLEHLFPTIEFTKGASLCRE